jgi:hypothetical protein
MKKIAQHFGVSEHWLRWGRLETGDLTFQRGVIHRLNLHLSTMPGFDADAPYQLVASIISPVEIDSIRLGRKELDITRFHKIAEKIGTPVQYLFFGQKASTEIDLVLQFAAEKHRELLRQFTLLSDDQKEIVKKLIEAAYLAEQFRKEHPETARVYENTVE